MLYNYVRNTLIYLFTYLNKEENFMQRQHSEHAQRISCKVVLGIEVSDLE